MVKALTTKERQKRIWALVRCLLVRAMASAQTMEITAGRYNIKLHFIGKDSDFKG